MARLARTPGIRVAFWTILVVAGLLLAELGAYSLSLLSRDLYSHEDRFLERIDFGTYQRYLESRFDPVVGWINQPGSTLTKETCTGNPIDHRANDLGAREYSSVDAEVVFVGDSFTWGSEVEDHEAYPAVLAGLAGIDVANHGVAAFGPLQATLRFEQVVDNHPSARIAVLGIMYENIRRVPTAYFPALYLRTRFHWGFKPYIARGEQLYIEPVPDITGADPKILVRSAFRDDYWAKPKARFPYTVRLLKTLQSNFVRLRIRGKLNEWSGIPKFAADYEDPDLSARLRFVMDRFIASAHERGIHPAIVFIPQSGNDLTSPASLIAEYQDSDATVFNVGDADMDWENYRHGPGCHPTPSGYRDIAYAVYQALRDRL